MPSQSIPPKTNPDESKAMTETLTPVENDERQVQPCGLLKLPPELRDIILKHIFQDHLDHIDTIPFPRPTSGDLFQPRFNKSHNVALCKRVLALLHTSRRLRLESFDVYMPLALGFWQTVRAEACDLRKERDRRGYWVVVRDDESMERFYRNALRTEGAMQVVFGVAAGGGQFELRKVMAGRSVALQCELTATGVL